MLSTHLTSLAVLHQPRALRLDDVALNDGPELPSFLLRLTALSCLELAGSRGPTSAARGHPLSWPLRAS